MAWNAPGGENQKPKDPWNRPQQPKGPPDLDEAWRKFCSKIKSLFRKKDLSAFKSNGNYHSDNNGEGAFSFESYSRMGLAVFAGIILIWFLSGIFIVTPAENAVILRFGRYVDTLNPGPHWFARFIEDKTIVNVGNVDNFSYGGSAQPINMLTKDENIVSVAVAVQFRINNPRDYLFNVHDPKTSLKQATASALRQVIGQSTLDDVLTVGRALIRQQVAEQLNRILALYHTGIYVTDVAMQPASAPEEVKDKFDEAIRAQEDEQRFINQAEAYARSVAPIAQGKAQRIAQEANAYKQRVMLQAKGDADRFNALLPQYTRAPQVMRQRLYVDAMESVLTKSSKILLDSGNSNVVYLPLDQLMRGPGSSSLSQNTKTESESTSNVSTINMSTLVPPTKSIEEGNAVNNTIEAVKRDQALERGDRPDRDAMHGWGEP